MKLPLEIPNEAQFATRFALACQSMGARYTQIPDVHKAAYAIAKKHKTRVPTYKRPCDGIFSCVQGMAYIELKHQNGKLKPHQIEHLRAERELHGNAYVLRAKETKRKGLVFTIEIETGEVIFESDRLDKIVFQLFETLYTKRTWGREEK